MIGPNASVILDPDRPAPFTVIMMSLKQSGHNAHSLVDSFYTRYLHIDTLFSALIRNWA